MITLDVDQSGLPADSVLSDTLLALVAKELNARIPSVPEGLVAVGFISDTEMQELNLKYRNKDKTTDVLSFSYMDDERSETLGDVVISFEQVKRQQEDGVEQEIVMLIIHGVLHVIGYDHEEDADAKEMFPLQDGIYDAVYE